MSEVILFYINKQELNWIRYAFTFGRSFSSHSTLSIAFKVSWPPTNLPIKSMLKGLTSSFSFRRTKQQCSQTKSDNSGGSRGGGRGARPSLTFRPPNWGPKGGKKFFWDRPPSPPPPYLKVWIRHWTIYNTRPEKFFYVQMSTTNASKCYLPNTECFSSKWRQERNVMKLQVNRSHYEFYSEWIRTLCRRG